ncbi:prenyltransferase [Paenarthrobacter ilicis]|uniref:Lycopene cyclase domain-containing protein n=1 Tax=Paenarthrobacter ilicis TaxID=43665 RepID=A0ABX0TGL3_9MICC|nr:prenyltransferase [Paenarthrobacter ilicis]MBM7791728.1 lycopene cyclase domain-containing protein [Paenarthrobacter ilicis]NIJ01647.1 lycopene cyclase domain-containing protein [Paenarthrobacter ilicis]
MTYMWLALAFIAAAVVAGVAFARLGSAEGESRKHWRAVGVAFAALAVLTAVFDSVMIGMELFHYDPAHILGAKIGLAPIEDFAYPLAGVVALPGLWMWLTRRNERRRNERNERRRNQPQQNGADAQMKGLVSQAVLASRPVSWINTAYPFAAAMLLTTREIDWVLVVGTFYFLIPYNLAMYGINDVFDYESDLKNPRKGGMEGALLQPRLHKPMLWLAAITNVPFLLVLAFAGGPAAWISLAVSAFAVVAYSAAGLRFKERPVLDSLTSSTHFVSPAVVGLALAGADVTPGLVILLVAFFLWGMAAHAFGAVQDIEPDRQAGIGSIATVIGARRTVRLAVVLWLVAGLAMLATPWPGPLAAIIAVPYIINCARHWNVTDTTAAGTNAAWRRFIWLNYGSGFLVTLIFILQWSLTS